MERYICLGCGQGFPWPAQYRDPQTGEAHLTSPCCRTAFREADRCQNCGRLIPREEGRLCPRCRKDAVDRFRQLLDRVTPAEREAINNAYDGVPLTKPERAA